LVILINTIDIGNINTIDIGNTYKYCKHWY